MKRTSIKKSLEKPVDWFSLGPDYSIGSPEMLRALSSDLKRKARLVDSLLDSFIKSTAKGAGVLYLCQIAESLENTIELRTTNMFAENEGAWFREGVGVSVGPFGGKVDHSPILSRYNRQDVRKVKTELRSAFDNYHSNVSSMTLGNCLWGQLLKLNEKYKSMNCLDWEGGCFRIDQLPDGIDPSLMSGNLSKYLQDVRSSFLLARRTLDNCFQRLYKTSNQLWMYQEKLNVKEGFNKSYNSNAKKIREEMADRRKAFVGARSVSLREREAYRYFGLEVTADSDEVKRKYRELAKKLHPDSASGSPEKFRYLTLMYQRLCG